MHNNLIFLQPEDLEKPIYRIFSFERLESIFLNRQLTLIKPSMWDDPFENFILGAHGNLSDGTPFNIGFRDYYYGQCWSRTRESDAMWRIYSPEKDGVKVKTTIGKLFRPLFDQAGSFQNLQNEAYNLSSFVGKVRYQSQKSLTEMLKDTRRMSAKVMDQSGWGQASSFYFKRLAFKHENEIRLIYRDSENPHKLFHFEVDPLHLFDEIVLDPRMSINEVQRIKNQLRNWGYEKKVIQSGLYKVPSFEISLSI